MPIDIVKRLGGFDGSMADAIGNPDKVWCRTCNQSQPIDAAECLRSGWPKCCGYTMTIDDLSAEVTDAD